jgi:uncharacterized protein YbjT (DUF2867 family)
VRIAITGANSNVGTTLLKRVASRDDLEARAGVRSAAAAARLPSGAGIVPGLVSYDDPGSLATLVDGAGCLVHLAGILIEDAHRSYQTANVDTTRAAVNAVRAAGVAHMVMISALGANPDSTNAYYRSKGIAERIVAESGCAATIIRTPLLLGPATAAGRSLVGMASRRSVRLLGGGRHTLRPLDVDDLCGAILNGCHARGGGVRILELVGPESVTQRELITRIARLVGNEVSITGVPVWGARLGATVTGWFRRGGMTPTVIQVITADETVHENADRDLGITLTPLTTTIEKLLPAKAASPPHHD